MGRDRNENRQNYRRRVEREPQKPRRSAAKYLSFFVIFLLCVIAVCLYFLWNVGKRLEKTELQLQEAMAQQTVIVQENPVQTEGRFEENGLTETEPVSESQTSEVLPEETKAFSDNDFCREVSKLMGTWQEEGENYAVSYLDLQNEGIREFAGKEQPMEAPGLMRLYVMAAIYEELNVKGTLTYPEGESDDSLRAKLEQMIQRGDDAAANELITDYLGEGTAETGMEKINQYCQDKGYADTHLYHLFGEEGPEKNTTSVKDCSVLLERIYGESQTETSNGEKMMSVMEEPETGSISQGVEKISKGCQVIGIKDMQEQSAGGEAAIVLDSSGKGCYVLCIMSENGAQGEKNKALARAEKFSQIASLAQEHWLSGHTKEEQEASERTTKKEIEGNEMSELPS